MNDSPDHAETLGQALDRRERHAFFDTMTPAEMREALLYLSGYSPDGVNAAIELCKQNREPAPHIPKRGDAIEAWLKARRDDVQRKQSETWFERDNTLDTYRKQSETWFERDNTLDAYRLHADTGTPLDQPCYDPGDRAFHEDVL